MKLLGNRVIVRPENTEAVTKGGILLPQQSIKKENRGTVVLKADGVSSVNAGDRVLFVKHAGQPIDYEGEECFLIYSHDIISVI